jgi:hypothetical protein
MQWCLHKVEKFQHAYEITHTWCAMRAVQLTATEEPERDTPTYFQTTPVITRHHLEAICDKLIPTHKTVQFKLTDSNLYTLLRPLACN